jgi:uncharacterized protein YndB with AHSA1/START domain
MMAMGSVVEMQKNVETEDARVEIVRVIKATRQRVFDAFTRPEVLRQWFGSAEMTAIGAETDAHAGGAYGITMDPAVLPPGTSGFSVKGRYVKVEPYDLLQFTWNAVWSPGEESMVTIALRDVEGGTEMRLVHEGFVTEVSCTSHGAGWKVGLDNMAKLLEA